MFCVLSWCLRLPGSLSSYRNILTSCPFSIKAPHKREFQGNHARATNSWKVLWRSGTLKGQGDRLGPASSPGPGPRPSLSPWPWPIPLALAYSPGPSLSPWPYPLALAYPQGQGDRLGPLGGRKAPWEWGGTNATVFIQPCFINRFCQSAKISLLWPDLDTKQGTYAKCQKLVPHSKLCQNIVWLCQNARFQKLAWRPDRYMKLELHLVLPLPHASRTPCWAVATTIVWTWGCRLVNI